MDTLNQLYDYARQNYIPIIDDASLEVLIGEIEKANPKRILEIGTAVGYSGAIMLQHSQASLDTIEIDEDRRNIAIRLWRELGLEERINSYLGSADEILEEIIEGKEYDFVFIDGPKSRCGKYYDQCFEHIKSGGIIFVDDVLFFGMVRGQEWVAHKHRTIVKNLRIFLDKIQSDERVDVKILDVGNGIAVIRKK